MGRAQGAVGRAKAEREVAFSREESEVKQAEKWACGLRCTDWPHCGQERCYSAWMCEAFVGKRIPGKAIIAKKVLYVRVGGGGGFINDPSDMDMYERQKTNDK
jgi:hypothetical protein